MSTPSARDHHRARVRVRARTVSWGLVPLLFVGIAVWFAYNLVVCMGSGRAQAWQLMLCSRFNLLPDALGIFLVATLVWLGFALRDLARATGGTEAMAGRSRFARPAVGARHAYRQLDADEQASLRFAVEMTAWAAAAALGTLVFYWLELAFPLALLVIAGVVTALVRLGRRGMGGLGTSRQPTTNPDRPPESVLPLNIFHVLEEEYVALHHALPAGHPGFDFTSDQIVTGNETLIPEDLANAAGGRSGATACGRYLASLLGGQWTETRLRALSVPELVAVLNDLLKRSDLYDAWPSTGAALRPETQEYIRLYFDVLSEKLRGEDLVRFHRLLLEDAYPTALKRLNDVRMAAIVARIHETPTAALCLSGGGIRSGTFSLGVLQALARRGLLPRMSYLSTVSGGGYIGSWLTAWCHRHVGRLSGVIDELTKAPGPKLEPEPEPLRQLREYASFMAPRPSLTSADVWSFVAIYVRNLLINWAALIPLLLAALLVPRIVAALFYARHVESGAAWYPGAQVGKSAELAWVFYGLLAAGFALSVLAVLYVTINRPSRADLLVPRSWWRRHREQRHFLQLALLPAVLAGLCLSTFWAWARAGDPPLPPDLLAPVVKWVTRRPLWLVLLVLAIAVYVLAILLAAVSLRNRPRGPDWVAAGFTGGGGGLLTWLLLQHTAFNAPVPPPGYVNTTGAWYATLAVPAYLMILFGGIVAFVAATSKRRAATWGKTWFSIEDEDREWLGRCGGWLFLTAVGWAALSALVIFGPLVLLLSPKILGGLGGISGLAAAIGGKSALTPATDKDASARGWRALVLDHLLTIAAVVFLALFIAALSLFSSWAVAWIVDFEYQPASQLVRWPSYAYGTVVSENEEVVPAVWSAATTRGQLAILYFSPVCRVAGLALVLAGLGLLAGWVINLNKFSLHAAYRSRIIRAFLGASRPADERVPNPFTGFDPQDNIQMHELRPGLLREASFKPGGFVKLADKLVGAQTKPGNDPSSSALVNALSSITNGMLHRHSPGQPLSQSLKRNLLEDLNRLLDGMPGLLDLAAFANLPGDDPARKIVSVVTQGGNTNPPPEWVGLTNAALEQKLPAHGHSNARLVLNRVVLASVYEDELSPLDWPPPPSSLLHVVGTALNLVGGKRLAWQQRRAESFTISPLHCGSLFRGYRRSRQYGGIDGISLGTAVTISGAAVSSNMGYHSSSSAITFVLTLFNARLGWWLGNPGVAGDDRSQTRYSEPPYRRAFPRMSLAPLVMEAFGLTDDTSRYVLLSDGGHFDNLGLYEMILRRCRFIVVVDGSQDENAAFDDLGATVRKIRIDLGVEIVFEDGLPIYKRESSEIKAGKGRYCAVATIRYPDGGSAPNGVLVYIKPTLLDSEPRDVLQYAAANPDFPHQTTLDQFFDESQFESYRRLGQHAVETICQSSTAASMTFTDFLQSARAHAGAATTGRPTLPPGF